MIPAGARCGIHLNIAAVDVCQRCGRFLCGGCVELAGEEVYCADCAARVNHPASAAAKAAVAVAATGWLALGAGFVLPPLPAALTLLVVPAPTAVAALALGLIEARRIKAGHSAKRGRGWAAAGCALGGLLLLVLAGLFALGAWQVWGRSLAG